MHAIFAAYKSANGCRGNMPFGNKGVLIEENQYGKIYKFKNIKFYEPHINKGALARASLYILSRYKNCANEKYLPK
jgi:endonuclease I